MSFKTIKCSDIIDVRDGTHDSPKYLDKGYPLITSKNIMENSIDFENVNLISEEDYNKINMRSSVKNGDILMPMIGTVGNPVLVNTNEKFAIKNVALFKLSENSEIDGKYFYYLLMSDIVLKQLEKNKRGGTQSFVSLKNLRELKIPYIGIEKQKKIVSILDKSKGLIDKRKEQIKLLDELVKSRFIEMFGDPILNPRGWKKAKLNDVCFKITDGEHQNPEFIDRGIPMVMANNIRDTVDLKNCKYISQEDYNKFSKKCKPEIGDVLLVSRGATIGRCCENTEEKDFSLMGSVILLKNNKKIIESKFLVNWFKHGGIKKVIYTTSSASAQQAIYMKDLKEKNIILPPIEVQNQFADFVKQVDKLKFEMEKSLKELEDNFNSLMQKAFKGELF